MIPLVNLSIRNATVEDRQQLANLIHFEVYVHRHLDWKSPLDWLGETPYLLVEQHQRITAALACPTDPPSVGWIRLFAASGNISVERAWQSLWPEASNQLASSENLKWAAALPMQHWFKTLLEESNFIQTNQVVMLNRELNDRMILQNNDKVKIRPMTRDDLYEVEKVDHLSFEPIWQNSRACLEMAFQQAAVATVGMREEKLIAYQISTATHMGGHLARLAVIPEFQGQGIGSALVWDLLLKFGRRGALSISVNTQVNNLASLKLYERAGFHRTGEEYPVYQYEIKKV